jgi:hypothetical protein
MVLSLSAASLLAAMLVVGPAPGSAGSSTAAEEFMGPTPELVTAIETARSVRVHTTSGRITVRHPSITTEGVTGVRPRVERDALVSDGTVPVLVAWKDIERIERSSSGVGRGAVRGMLIGAASVGTLWLLTDRPDAKPHTGIHGGGFPSHGMRGFLAVSAGAMAGTVLGALVGVNVPRWKTIAVRSSAAER